MANGIALVRELSDRTRARVMANGELMATEIGARFLEVAGHRRHLDGRARHVVGRRSRRLGQGFGAVGHLFVRARCRARAAARRLDAGGDHAGLHRPRQRRQHLPAGPRRLGHLGGLSRREDPRASRSRSGPTCPACSAPIRARRPRARLIRALHYDEAQEIATSGAKVLHPRCLLPARQYQIPLYVYATQTPDLEGTLITGESGGGRAGEGGLQSQGHHADLARQPRHVAPGRLHGRRVRGVQGTRHVGGPGVDLGDQRHRVARSGGQHARRRVARQAASATCRSSAACRSSGPAPRCRWSAATSAPSCTSSAMRSRCSRSRRCTCVSQAANDLNFTFVVDENQGDRLVEQLHDLLIRPLPGDTGHGPDLGAAVRQARGRGRARAALVGGEARGLAGALAQARLRLRLRSRAGRRRPRRPSRGIKSIGRALFALKANPHPEILRTRRGRGARLRLRVAGGDRARARRPCPASRRIASCSRRISRRAPNTSARSRSACTSPSTTCSCCSTGSMPSRARACSCASTPASAAAITTT